MCVDFDGAERLSQDGASRGRYVPLWVVGRDPNAPAQLFGRVGATPRLPAVQSPVGPQPTGPSAGGPSPQVYVEERCHLLSVEETCARHVAERRELQRRIFNAQSSERAILVPRSNQLRELLATYCGG
jgi:hypothetical protein